MYILTRKLILILKIQGKEEAFMGVIWVIFWVISSIIFYNESSSLFMVSLILGVLNLWSLGILHNYKYDTYTPRVWGLISILTSIASIVFIIIAIL